MHNIEKLSSMAAPSLASKQDAVHSEHLPLQNSQRSSERDLHMAKISAKFSRVSRQAPKETNESYLAMTSPKQSEIQISYAATTQQMDVASSQSG